MYFLTALKEDKITVTISIYVWYVLVWSSITYNRDCLPLVPVMEVTHCFRSF